VVLEWPKELYAKNTIKGHKEEKEEGDIVDLLAGPSAKKNTFIQ